MEIDEEQEDNFPWNRERTQRPHVEHYKNQITRQQWYEQYGCNFTSILYPIKRCPLRRKAWIDRMGGAEPNFPKDMMVAECEDGLKCEAHQNPFSTTVKTSSYTTVYYEKCEKVYNIATYARGTGGLCHCKHQIDGDKYQLWHLKNGRFIDYIFLHKYILQHLSSGQF